MRYIKYLLLIAIAVVVISEGLANSEDVTLTLFPADIAELIGFNSVIQLPLFVVIFASLAVGLFIGFFWEWVREYKQRSAAAAQAREMDRMRRELKRLKSEKYEGTDDVLAILDEVD